MNKRLKGLLIIGCLIAFYCVCNVYSTHYNRVGVVTKINGDEVIVKDTTENTWVFKGTGFAVGNNVKLKMFNNNTDFNIYDDEVKDVIVVTGVNK